MRRGVSSWRAVARELTRTTGSERAILIFAALVWICCLAQIPARVHDVRLLLGW
ncbi:hypothetical protein [Rubellimicrobium aerolatum]|uniref:Uncharacterized protein n=1 Tax=Rubellimicrobium aerolatum TaxID=490979 RepID=A0ABW0SEZ8_9RHOB|nr:hypothetical protein [Rubellimicrobium aerolatum]MBP1806446.1 hypothetical protein [Rubellimicrobium aerolatum]